MRAAGTASSSIPAGDGIRVGVVDSGWDRTLVEPRVEDGVSFVGGVDELTLARGTDDQDRIGHGTACADIILRVAPGVSVVPVRVFGTCLETSVDVLVAAIEWGIDQRLPLLNLSLGTQRHDAMVSLYRICERARREGTIIVASSTDVRPELNFPAIFDSVISVGAGDSDLSDDFWYCAGHRVECRAKPVQWARGIGGRWGWHGGASFAAPVVTARIAGFLGTLTNRSVDSVRAHLAAHHVRPHILAAGNGFAPRRDDGP